MRLLYRSPAGEAPRPYAPASMRRTAAERSGGGVHSSPSRSLTRGRSVMIRGAHRCKHQELADLLLRSRINDAPSAWRHEGVILPPASSPAQRSAVSIWEASSACRSQAGAVAAAGSATRQSQRQESLRLNASDASLVRHAGHEWSSASASCAEGAYLFMAVVCRVRK